VLVRAWRGRQRAQLGGRSPGPDEGGGRAAAPAVVLRRRRSCRRERRLRLLQVGRCMGRLTPRRAQLLSQLVKRCLRGGWEGVGWGRGRGGARLLSSTSLPMRMRTWTVFSSDVKAGASNVAPPFMYLPALCVVMAASVSGHVNRARVDRRSPTCCKRAHSPGAMAPARAPNDPEVPSDCPGMLILTIGRARCVQQAANVASNHCSQLFRSARVCCTAIDRGIEDQVRNQSNALTSPDNGRGLQQWC